jgi:hypothetical protein
MRILKHFMAVIILIIFIHSIKVQSINPPGNPLTVDLFRHSLKMPNLVCSSSGACVPYLPSAHLDF